MSEHFDFITFLWGMFFLSLHQSIKVDSLLHNLPISEGDFSICGGL